MHTIRSKHPRLNTFCQRLVGVTRNKDMVIPQGPAKGLRFRRGRVPVEYGLGIMEPEVQKVCQFLVQPGMVVFDIGANIGFFTILFGRLVGEKGQVYAFEPFSEAATQANENARLNEMSQIEVVRAAVGSQCGEEEFLLGESSLMGRLSDGRVNHTETVVSEKVPVVTIDHFVLERNHAPPSFVKIDVEGGEVDVLHGMKEVLQQHRPVILCEIHNRNKEVSHLLREVDYQTQVIECNCPLEIAPWNVHAVAWHSSEIPPESK